MLYLKNVLKLLCSKFKKSFFLILIFALVFLLITNEIDIFRKNTDNNYSMFFLESNSNQKEFTTKEMCAIESAAKVNPKAIVKVYTFTAKLNWKTNELLKIYPNLKVIKFEPEVVFKNTPLLQWWSNGLVLTSPYSNAHIADAFR